MPTSEATSLGARGAEVWLCAPARLSLSCCRPGDDVRVVGGREGTVGGVGEGSIQRAYTMSVPSATIWLQRPPPPLTFAITTEERTGERVG